MNPRSLLRVAAKLLLLAFTIVLLAEPALQVHLESNLLSNDNEPVLAVRSKRSLDSQTNSKDAKLVDVSSQQKARTVKKSPAAKKSKPAKSRTSANAKPKSKPVQGKPKKGPAKANSKVVNAKNAHH